MWNSFDEEMMRLALAEATVAAQEGEVPVGAVLVQDGHVLSTARNKKEHMKSAQGHAELLLLAEANRLLNRWRLTDCVMYATLEPCLMCAGAILHSRLPKIVFGARDPKFGGVKSLYESLQDSRSNHQVDVQEGLYAEDSRALLKKFFAERRNQAK